MVQSTQLAGNVTRPSPLSGGTPQTSRSPMPPGQQPGVAAGQHPQQPTAVQQMQSQQMYNYANQYRMTMAQNPSLLAAMQHAQQTQQAQAQTQQQGQQQGQTQTQPQQPSQTPQMQAATPEQQAQAQVQQAHAHAQALQMMPGYPMFNVNYAQMGMNVPMQGRFPGYQWPAAMGFRRPVNGGVGVNGMNVPVNGQTAQMQAAHAQQMRAMQANGQGR